MFQFIVIMIVLTVVLIVLVSCEGPPAKLKQCATLNQSVSSLEVSCEPGDDGGLRQRFHLEVYNSPLESLTDNLSSSTPLFTVTGLPPSTNFILVLYASNLKGRGDSFTTTTRTLPVAQRRISDQEPLKMSPVLAVLIGIVGALVIVAVAIVVVMRLRGEEEKVSAPQETEMQEKPEHPPSEKAEEQDIVKKGPDVIPPQNGSPGQCEDKSSKDYSKPVIYPGEGELGITKSSLRQASTPSRGAEEVTYAELSLAQFPTKACGVGLGGTLPRRGPTDSPTEYAQIDFQWGQQGRRQDRGVGHPDDGVETPLITSIHKSNSKSATPFLLRSDPDPVMEVHAPQSRSHRGTKDYVFSGV